MKKTTLQPLSHLLRSPSIDGLNVPPASASASLRSDAQIPAPLQPQLDLPPHNHSSSSTSKPPSEPRLKSFVLPPVPRLRGLARILEPKEFTAVRWVKKCCPEISHNGIEKLFRRRQVKMCLPISQSDDGEQSRQKRITRKEIVPEGSVLYLPKSVLQSMDCTDDQSNRNDASELMEGKMEKVKCKSLNVMEYKPTRADIEWARELVLHMDAYVIAVNKPPGLPVQGGVGVGRSLDALLASAFGFNHSETPKLVHRLDKETSGVMVVGKTQESAALLHNLFRAKTENAIAVSKDTMLHDRVIKRKYWALVIGAPAVRKGRITAALKKVVPGSSFTLSLDASIRYVCIVHKPLECQFWVTTNMEGRLINDGIVRSIMIEQAKTTM